MLKHRATLKTHFTEAFVCVTWLAFTLLGAVYSLCYMDLKKDTLLYSKFNPNWKHVRA